MLHSLKICGASDARDRGVSPSMLLSPRISYFRGGESGVEEQRGADPVKLRQGQLAVLDGLGV